MQDDEEENILYDLNNQVQWPQESEIFARNQRERNHVSLFGRLNSATQRSVWTFLRVIRVPLQTTSPCSLPPGLLRLVNSEISWHIAVGKDASVIAVLRDHCVEIRSRTNEYETVIGKGSVPRDPYPQWRRLSWSPDNTMIACSQSNGTVDVFDLIGTKLFSISGEVPKENSQSLDLSCAIAGLVFTDVSPGPPWSAELLVVNYRGSLKSYYVDRDQEYKQAHSFLFISEYPLGVSSVEYNPQGRLLFVGGCGTEGSESQSGARHNGLTAWRILSGPPHYILISDYGDSSHPTKPSGSFMNKLKAFNVFRSSAGQDGVYKMCLSPDNRLLATIHHSGKLCLWNVPSLKLYRSWTQEQQPGFGEVSPEFTDNPQRRKTLKDLVPCKNILDVNWWSNEAIILSRCTGAVTVSSAATLKNLLGASPEWFEPSTRITPVHDGGFLTLEVESRFPQKRRFVDDMEDDQNDSDEEDASWVTKSTRFTKSVLSYVRHSEMFQPPRKRPKMINRTYRLLCLKSTTPEELYARKIDNEEYGEALALSKAYGLDSDLVYQRQWRKSTASIASIQDYLSKIKKRSWVLHECLEWMPTNIDATKELLEFGLRGTDLQALIAIGKGEDGGRFILCDPEDGLYDMSFDEFDEEEAEREKEEMRKKRQQELLQQVDFSRLNLQQSELCRVRLKLLQYMDRLKTYEYILGGPAAAVERFDDKFFHKFRSQNIVEAAVEYARQSDWKALDALFTFHGDILIPHRLGILSNFPETTSVIEYRSLLPEVSGDGTVVPWEVESWRETDWCEDPLCKSVVEPLPIDLGAFLYEENCNLLKFRVHQLTKELLTDWYTYRACEIEDLSRQVENSAELIKMAMERGVEGLSDLLDDLVTMEMLVYDCHIQDALSFEDLRRMADYDKLELIMSNSTEEMYTKQVHHWLVPFLNQCERRLPGSYSTLLRDYIVTMAKSDLTNPYKIIDASKPNMPHPVIKTQDEVMSISLEAVYTCEREDQLPLVLKILHCLPKKQKSDSKETLKLHRKVDSLEQHHSAAKILEEYGVKKPLYYIRDSEQDADEAKNLMTRLTRVAGHMSKPLTVSDWRKLHEDVLTLQDQVYRCISAGLCHEIFTESLLCSSRKESITLAGELIERTADDIQHIVVPHSQRHRVPYDRAVQLVILSAQEYFNSSTNLTDSCMDLARSCLNLIRDTPAVIQEELDLIGSLALLDDFNVSVLPLQIRLCKDRIELVKQAITSKTNAFKNEQKLLRLGHLLRVEGENRELREGKILHLIAEAAVQGGDCAFAHKICLDLMDRCYGDAWNVCMDLAWQESFSDIAAKAELLSFAVTYCSPGMLEPILQAKDLLETQILYSSVNTGIHAKQTPGEETATSHLNVSAALQQTQKILTSTTKSTKSFLSAMTDKTWWQGTITALKQPVKRQVSEGLISDSNENFKKQGCHPFYEDSIDCCHVDLDAADYVNCKSYEDPDTQTSLDLLRAVNLEEMLTEGERTQPTTDMLLKLAKSKLPVDSALGLAFLLALPQPLSAEECFDDFPRTAISIQLALYYYALQIYTTVNPLCDPEPSVLYLQPPLKVIQKVVHFVKHKKDFDWPEEVKELVVKLQQYHELLVDYMQAKTLKNLDRGIDTRRFTEDDQYRKETICGLAMSLEDKVYGVSLNLADRYNIPLWEVYMAHLEFLFSESQLTTEEIEERVTKMKILPTLTDQPQEFQDKMHTFVFPCIEGTDHTRLIYYYTLLSSVSDVGIKGKVSADTHVKLLKKLKTAAEGLDYKKLMEEGNNPVDVIVPVLSASNVSVIAKLANKIPDGKDSTLHSSIVYYAWAVKIFWGKESKKNPDSKASWVHRFESCGETLQKLLPEDIVKFVDAVVFVLDAREMLGLDCRQEIVKRSLKLCRQQSGAGKKKKSEMTSSKMSWEAAVAVLQNYQSHLTMLQNDVIQSLELSETPKLKLYAAQIDLSRGQQDKVKDILIHILLDGESVEMIEDMLEVLQIPGWTPRTVVQEAVTLVIAVLSNDGGESRLTTTEAMTSLQAVVQNIQEHHQQGGNLVSVEDVMVLMRPFSSDSSVAVKPRLDALHVLEKSFELSAEDLVLLILYRTEAVVTSAWGDNVTVKESDISTEENRLALFKHLLSQAETCDQTLALCKLLQLWPSLQASKSSLPEENVWVNIFDVMVDSKDVHCITKVVPCIRDVKQTCPLSKQCIQHIHDKLLSQNSPVEAVKSVLVSGDEALMLHAVAELALHQHVTEDVELFDLLLQNNLVTSIVTTKYYPAVIEYLLSNQKPGMESSAYLSVDVVADHLKEAGFEAEAGSLLLRNRSTHTMLQTFGAAFGVLERWLKR